MGIFREQFLRRPALLALGYRVINPRAALWVGFPSSLAEKWWNEVLCEIGIARFGTLIDHACSTGLENNRFLPSYAERLFGVDIIAPQNVFGRDPYIQVSADLRDEYFAGIPDGVADGVVVMSTSGCGVRDDWRTMFSQENRLARYITQPNYPRLLKSGAYLIRHEWEAAPEKRVGRASLADVKSDIDRYYPHPDIPGFAFVTKGFSISYPGPWIVYRRL